MPGDDPRKWIALASLAPLLVSLWAYAPPRPAPRQDVRTAYLQLCDQIESLCSDASKREMTPDLFERRLNVVGDNISQRPYWPEKLGAVEFGNVYFLLLHDVRYLVRFKPETHELEAVLARTREMVNAIRTAVERL